ncbi:MAG: nucleotide-binding protein [Ferrovibrio sp.]|nr:nucleotide-binding protein [Ferrovibrio sp.]
MKKIKKLAEKRSYLKQADVPSASLEEALRIPRAIFENYAGRPTSPLFVAKAVGVDPKGSQIRVLSGASIAFGLIEGGAQASSISITDLARRILRPTSENSETPAMQEAVLRPRIFGEFLRAYDGNAFPREDIALNVLEEMGVPRDKVAEVLERIESSARQVGFLEEIRGKKYVTLQGANGAKHVADEERGLGTNIASANEDSAVERVPTSFQQSNTQDLESAQYQAFDEERRKRVFITHGKNRDLVDPMRKLLEFGELIPVVSVERQSVSKPVPEKVMDDMRSCGAAIIHVDAEQLLINAEGNPQPTINPNVLIEIGAAMAFYGRRFILLVKEGITLPSNLQGLYEVRYKGDVLDAGSTIKLLEAIKDIKNYALPILSTKPHS